jgi:RHS repeat-associated protein
LKKGTTLGEYTYNGLGQRIIKNSGGVTTVFLYDFDGNIIGESDSSGSISREYLYKGSSRLAMVDVPAGNMYYYGNDQLGTPQIMTDSTNTVVWEADYKPFGEADINPNSSVVNNFRFPGQYYDQETRLHYNYHRYYDPSTGRYLTADPIGLEGGMNLFTYAEGNPINTVDSRGLSVEVGGGFSFTVPGYHFNTSVTTETCCDDNGKKHKRTIQTTCFGFSLGFEIGGGSGPGGGSVSWGGSKKKCKGNEYHNEEGFGFQSGLVFGASWSSDDPTKKTLTTGLGGALHFWSECHSLVKQDVIIGDCCDR